MEPEKKQQKSGGGWGRFVQSVQSSVQKKQDELREAREAREAGKIFNSATGQWEFYFLDDEWRQLLQESQDSSVQDSFHEADDEREVADREYYDLLQVSTNADATTIKKAYYRLARQCHPDKCPDDPEAHEKFQKLGQAYQVLSDEKKRAAYDKDGKPDGNEESLQQVDAFVFFNVMFGSALVEPYIGELWLASHADSMMNEGDLMDGIMTDEGMPDEERNELIRERMQAMREKDEIKQRKRQVKCARYLRDRIQLYEKDPDSFALGCREEATKIVNGAYGAMYCETIGFSLQVGAEEYLGRENTFLGLGGHMARTKMNASGFATNMKLLGAGIKAASAGSRAMREAQDLQTAAEISGQELGEEQAMHMAQTIDGSLPAFLEFAWAVNKKDIKSTLKEVCKKVFDDASVPKEMRIERAKAVQILGQEFLRVGKHAAMVGKSKDPFGPEDIKARAAVAAMTTMAKAQGQEVTEEDQEQMIQQAKKEMSTVGGQDGGSAETSETADAERLEI